MTFSGKNQNQTLNNPNKSLVKSLIKSLIKSHTKNRMKKNRFGDCFHPPRSNLLKMKLSLLKMSRLHLLLKMKQRVPTPQ